MMTLDEAIAHARDVASEQRMRSGVCTQNGTECDKFSACLQCAEEHEQLAEWLEELQQYREIGTVVECREAVDKYRAKRPTYEGDGYAPDGTFVWDEWICQNCGTRYEVDYDDYDYCPNCGQAIDWSEE